MPDVRAELNATVWKVRVDPGRAVAAGEELLVLESMKMEIPVESPSAGTVAEVVVAEGAKVREGDVLVRLDPVA